MTRLEKLQSRMDASSVDLIVLAPGAHMVWLLGFSPHADERDCLLLIGQERVGFVMPALNAGDARQHTELPFWEWADEDGPDGAMDAAFAAIAARPRTIAIDETMRADHAFRVLAARPEARHSLAAPIIGPLRMVKDRAELDALQDNARIADAAQTALREAIREGVSEQALADVAQRCFERHGARTAFTIVAAGAHSAFPHHHTGETLVTPGDVLVVDIGGTKGGYYSDITRMACLGQPPEGYEEVHSVVDAAISAVLAMIRPGVEASQVDAAARDVITQAGYGSYFTHRTGHGLGSEVHEPPYITAVNDLRLQEGMVFTVEPGIYLPNRFGIRLEEVAVVTADGCRVLSELSRDLYKA